MNANETVWVTDFESKQHVIFKAGQFDLNWKRQSVAGGRTPPFL